MAGKAVDLEDPDQSDSLTRINDMLAEATEHFVGDLAHDLKNPLAAIKVNVQGMTHALDRGRQLTPEQLRERLRRIDVCVDQAVQLMNVARSRLTQTAVADRPLNTGICDLVQLAKQVVDLHAPGAHHHDLQLRTPYGSLLGTWDAEALGQTLAELVTNALKFTPKGGKVTVDVTDERHDGVPWAMVKVRDDGIGIPEGDQLYVFERFYRGENVVGKYKGAGLGLFEARRTVEEHDGTISISSEPGCGTTVALALPIQRGES